MGSVGGADGVHNPRKASCKQLESPFAGGRGPTPIQGQLMFADAHQRQRQLRDALHQTPLSPLSPLPLASMMMARNHAVCRARYFPSQRTKRSDSRLRRSMT